MKIRIVPDPFGWLTIYQEGRILQGFRTIEECRQFLADTSAICSCIFGYRTSEFILQESF